MSTLPIDAVSATDEPEIAPKKVDARMLTRDESAADETDEHRREANQPACHASFGHNRAREHEERDREQREVVHAVGDLEHHCVERDVDPERADERRDAERVGDRHAERDHQEQAAEQHEGVHARLAPVRGRRLVVERDDRPIGLRSCDDALDDEGERDDASQRQRQIGNTH